MDRDNLSKQSGYRSRKKGGKLVPALCNVVGALILLAVIAVTQISSLPKYYGLDAYNMTSSNMVPTIPIGSVVYVRRLDPSELPSIGQDELIAALTSDDSVGFFRVVENNTEEGEFITKGDFYEEVDEEPARYENVFGLVERHYPLLGDIMTITSSTAGRINLIVFAICGVLLNVLAWRLRRSQEDE